MSYAICHNGFILTAKHIDWYWWLLRLKCLRSGDRSGNRIYFNSLLLSNYLKRLKSVEEFLSWLSLPLASPSVIFIKL
ncbi:MAG: hypothetical protein ACTS73_07310 [Arsenophonus sp. NEOnobi-MAG3]